MATPKEARVPDIGGFDDVPVIEVLVAVGDAVTVDQSLVTLESDKATMEVPAPFAGVVTELKVKVGDTLSQGSVVALIEPADDATSADGAAPESAAAAGKEASKSSSAPAEEQPAEQSGEPAKQERPAKQDKQIKMEPSRGDSTEAAEAEAEAETEAVPHSPPVVFDADELLPGKVPYASPAVRLLARELGVDLMQVAGSERGGRIVKQDVQQFVKQAMQGGAVAGGGNGLELLPWPKVDFSKFGEIETRELTRIQKLSGANLARNWAMIPHVTQFEDADITGLESLRNQLNKENEKGIAKGEATKLTMLAFLMKAVVSALQKFPDFNASLDGSGQTLVLKRYFHIGFAADTPNGLVVPVVRDCDRKGVMQIAAETAELAAKARAGKLGPGDMHGGCFTISSLGGIGGTKFTPIINAPEVAILGVSRSDTRPVWDGNAFQPRLVLPLSLSYDHRVIDGASAARFAAYLSQVLADLRRVLL